MKKKKATRRREKKLQEIRSLPEGVAYRMSAKEHARLLAPRQEVNFKVGAHITDKDRPRNNNWRKWDYDVM